MNENLLLKKFYGYQFKISKYFQESSSLIFKNFGLFFGFTVIFSLIIQVISFVPILSIFGTIFVVPALTAGYYTAANQVDKGEKLRFSHFFSGFKQIKQLALIQLSIALLVVFALTTAVYLLVESNTTLGIISFFRDLNSKITNFWELPTKEIIIILTFICLIPIFCYTIYALSVPILLFERTDFWNALKLSRALVLKKIAIFFALFILGSLVYYTLYFFIIYKGIAFLILKNSSFEGLEVMDLFVPKFGFIGLALIIPLIASLISSLVLPFFHCFLFSVFKDLQSDNDIDNEYMKL